MPNYYLGSVADVDIFDGSTLIGTSKTQTDNSWSVSVNATEVRSGQGAVLNSIFYSQSKMEISLKDQMWKMDFIAKSIGGNITVGANDYVEESVVLASANAGTVVKTPASFGTYGTVGWVSIPKSGSWSLVTFTGNGFTSPVGTTGSTVCVRFFTSNPAARQLTVSSNIIPATVRLVMKTQLFAGDDQSTATKVGYVVTEVPRFQFDASVSINMVSSGVSDTPLKGMALATEAASCGQNGYYATITEVITSKNWYDDVSSIVVLDSDVTLAVAGTQTLEIRAINSYGNVFRPPYADLTFTSGTPAKATCSSAGVVTGVASGTSNIEIKITAVPTVKAFAVATVA